MGNQQTTLDFEYDDSDSGLGSPFESNSSGVQSFFDHPETSSTVESPNSIENPQFTSTSIKAKADFSFENITNGISSDSEYKEPPSKQLQQRRTSLVRSNTIEIARSVNSVNKYLLDEENDEFNCDLPIDSLRSGQTNVSMLSVSFILIFLFLKSKRKKIESLSCKYLNSHYFPFGYFI